jgi:hypothetical protein
MSIPRFWNPCRGNKLKSHRQDFGRRVLPVVLLCLVTVDVRPNRAEDPASEKMSLETLRQLGQQWNTELRPGAKRDIAEEILDVGAPLVAGTMAPSKASSIAATRSSNGQQSEDQSRYIIFWVIRARAAVEAGAEAPGLEAAKVLKQLGGGQSEKSDEFKAMAALNTKGWLNSPDAAEWQKVIDAVSGVTMAGKEKGAQATVDALNAVLAEVEALLKKYPTYAKARSLREFLVIKRNQMQDALASAAASIRGPAGSPVSSAAAPSPARTTKANFKNAIGCTMVWMQSLGIWVGETEVTQREFTILMDQNPSKHIGDHLPVESVTAFEAKEWCDRLTKKDATAGLLPSEYAYTLPTDEQWTVFCGGSTLDDAITSRDGARIGPEPVKRLGPNEYGLYDVRGNVWEWTRTRYDSSLNSPEIRSVYLFGAVQNGERNGATTGLDPNGLVLRGGSWRNKGDLLSKTTRNSNDPNTRDNANGFRVVLAPRE